jgi:flotillin
MDPILVVLGGAVLVAAVVLSAFAALFVATNLLYICEPNEVLIFSGGLRKQGYRVVKGGRSLRTPLFERVDRMDLTNMVIDVSVSGAYSKGGIPLTVQGVANLKIAGHEPKLGNAVERLLGKSRQDIIKIAKDVLEGTLRGVLARLTPEEVNEDKLQFAEKLLEEAEHDLAKLGLNLDNMKIQNVSDDRGYLNSLGRRKSAEIIKSSRIAEAKAEGHRDHARRVEPRARPTHRDRQRRADLPSPGRAAGGRRAHQGQVAHRRGGRAGGGPDREGRRARSKLRRPGWRRSGVGSRADVVEPARASMEAGIAEAKGNAAKILEQGRATVKVLDEMIDVWKSAGADARDIFLMQKLQTIMATLAGTLTDLKVDKITMLPDYGDRGGPDTARQAVRLVEELKGAIGVDLPKLLDQATSGRSG